MGTGEHIRRELESLIARGEELRGEIDQICEDLDSVSATETQDVVNASGEPQKNVTG